MSDIEALERDAVRAHRAVSMSAEKRDGRIYRDAVSYALARIEHDLNPIAGPRCRLKSKLNPKDMANAYAMARVMGLVQAGRFWEWAERAGLVRKAK